MWKRTVFQFVCMALFFGDLARGDESLSIKLGTGTDYPPFVDQTMAGGGVASELVALVFVRMGYQADLIIQPWNRLLLSANSHDVQAIYPQVRTAARQAAFLYSDPLFTVKTRFFGRSDGPDQLHTLPSHKRWHICWPNGYALSESTRSNLPAGKLEWERPSSLSSCFAMLARGRVDLIAINRTVGNYMIERFLPNAGAFRSYDQFEEENTLHLLIPRDLPSARTLLESFNRQLAQVKADPAGRALQDAISQRRDPR